MTSKSLDQFWSEATRVLAAGSLDIPFAATYTTQDPAGSSGSSASSHASFSLPKNIDLKSIVGLVKNNNVSRRCFEATSENDSLVTHLHRAAETNDIVHLNSETFPVLSQVLCRPHKDKCREAVILPIRPTTRDYVGGFVLIGLNPRRPWDEDHQSVAEPKACFPYFDAYIDQSQGFHSTGQPYVRYQYGFCRAYRGRDSEVANSCKTVSGLQSSTNDPRTF